jgi:hypothetical protein
MPNNNIILIELAKVLDFDLKLRRLCYTGYIFNLIAEIIFLGKIPFYSTKILRKQNQENVISFGGSIAK